MPLHAPHVGMYVCGPTVYGDAHLGHARPAITFDLLFRYLTHLGYKVRYVRNITDVGHLEHDADDGEDKIAKKARLEQLEPMEVVQYYLNRYHQRYGSTQRTSAQHRAACVRPYHRADRIGERKSWITDMHTKAKVPFTSTWRNTTRIIITVSFPDATWTMY